MPSANARAAPSTCAVSMAAVYAHCRCSRRPLCMHHAAATSARPQSPHCCTRWRPCMAHAHAGAHPGAGPGQCRQDHFPEEAVRRGRHHYHAHAGMMEPAAASCKRSASSATAVHVRGVCALRSASPLPAQPRPQSSLPLPCFLPHRRASTSSRWCVRASSSTCGTSAARRPSGRTGV